MVSFELYNKLWITSYHTDRESLTSHVLCVLLLCCLVRLRQSAIRYHRSSSHWSTVASACYLADLAPANIMAGVWALQSTQNTGVSFWKYGNNQLKHIKIASMPVWTSCSLLLLSMTLLKTELVVIYNFSAVYHLHCYLLAGMMTHQS